MSEMIERVAKAIYDAPTSFDGDQIGVHLGNSMMIDGSAVDAENLRRIVMSVCVDAARAAIEAMRRPAEEIIRHAQTQTGMAEILERQQRDHTSPFAPVRDDPQP